MAKEVVGVSVEQNLREGCCEVVCDINRSVHTFEVDEIPFDPFTSAKYLISICRVRVVGFCAFPMAVQPSLSS